MILSTMVFCQDGIRLVGGRVFKVRTSMGWVCNFFDNSWVWFSDFKKIIIIHNEFGSMEIRNFKE
jgi:hypothetical protein